MNMKWNWGTKLMIAFSMYLLMVISFVVYMFQQDISLVERDYYPKGQAHQELIDKINNTIPYATEIAARLENGRVKVVFPAFFDPSKIQGHVHIYHRITDKNDQFAALVLDENNLFSWPVHDMKGRYILKIDWRQNGIDYYTEKNITIE